MKFIYIHVYRRVLSLSLSTNQPFLPHHTLLYPYIINTCTKVYFDIYIQFMENKKEIMIKEKPMTQKLNKSVSTISKSYFPLIQVFIKNNAYFIWST